ncbi:MAG: LysR family transcriptional regulator [Treponema sp.]|jgi:lysyl-tRNA synthetase class 2|nr:LysR family transcriptional regulator [Treponema sp.]
MDLELLRERAKIIHSVRSFFDRRGYLETDTPILAPDLIPESCLEVFETRLIFPTGSFTPEKPYWLVPSPEIWMKRLIAQHRTSIYQICKCFRNGESSGRQHSPEFTMLEYYTMKADHLDSLRLTEELFAFMSPPADLSPPFIRMTVREAFRRWAGFDLYEAAKTQSAMEEEARRLGLNPPPGLSVAELYDLVFIHAVEPQLIQERPVALLDYPAFVPCLAKKSADRETVERWEIYARGIELANCFSEETQAEEVRRFFESERAEKEKTGLVRHKVDEDYWKLFAPLPEGSKFPECSGVAMGLDRLIMLLCGRSTIDGILPFPMD